MISVLIPTYNYDCSRLVGELHRQGQALLAAGLHFEYEILVGDDASTDSASLAANREVNRQSHCRFVEFSENRGRAAIRNELARMARYEYLLFIDSDAQVCSTDFLRRYYLSAPDRSVVVGGLFNVPVQPSPAVSLRYRYEEAVQPRWTVAYREKHPYDAFATFNFLIRKDVFMQIRFDERCQHYGYEDTLFGFELERRGIPVLHIDNRLVHTGLEENGVFLRKTETALRTLAGLDERTQHRVRVSRTANVLRRYGCATVFRSLHRIFSGTERKHLCGKSPSLFVFNLYKLGYYLTLTHSGNDRPGNIV